MYWARNSASPEFVSTPWGDRDNDPAVRGNASRRQLKGHNLNRWSKHGKKGGRLIELSQIH